MAKAVSCVPAWVMPLLRRVCGLFCGRREGRRRCFRGTAQDYLHTHLGESAAALSRLMCEAPEAGVQAAAIARLGKFPLWYGGQTRWFSEGEACFRAMLRDLRRAEERIWLAYDMIRPGVMWEEILSILRQKAAQGVDVRVIYDGFGCLPHLPCNFPKLLCRMRIRCCVFHPIRCGGFGGGARCKLMLIDGRVCYTGGIGLSDACIGLRQQLGSRKEGTIRLEGEAVHSLSVRFLSRWTALSGIQEPPPQKAAMGRESYIYLQPFWGFSLQSEAVGHSALTNLIGRAQESILLMTPCLSDAALCKALCLAAASGLDVKVITADLGGKRHTRAHWEKLLEAGVKLFAYAPGILCTEFCCADGQTAIVGNGQPKHSGFGAGLWLYGRSAVGELTEDFTATLEKCRPIYKARCTSFCDHAQV